ncbi:hypothetical protein DEO72_LG8g2070 [Vigna unguiculata]|uniref:Uncharacterized protein n=1 Tax=Vigna unguiculata TaxID=3917 RepID=A0A4D6MVW3_VIGUN|nr:hypothetical protein DEO72_LG8g2070 [Vigna unguiculata]
MLPLRGLNATTTNHHEPVELRDPAPPPPFEAELQAIVAGNPTTVSPSPLHTKEESDHQNTPLP